MLFGRKNANKSDVHITTQRYDLQAGGHKLFGELVRPKKGPSRLPLVICSHGFNGSYEYFKGNVADSLAKAGYAVYYFDFYAGSKRGKSGGSMLEQSPLDEARQLADIMEHFRTQSFIDPKRIILFGESQGGFVSAYAAARAREQVKALILYYPAFCIMDDIKKKYPTFDALPERIPLFGLTLSPHYYNGLYDFDIYDIMPGYRGPVLLTHGDMDSVVPVSYGRRAAAVYENCEYHEFPGQNHGYTAEGKEKALGYVLDFLNRVSR